MGNYVLIYFGFKIKYNLFTIYKRVKQMNEYTSLCFLLLKSVKQLSNENQNRSFLPIFIVR